MLSFLNYLISGISLGSIYAIIALGYTMVYGIAKMLNFAHGDFIMVGGYAIFTCMITLGLNPFLSILIAMGVCLLIGVGTEKIAYKPLREAGSPLAVLITAIGVSYLLENLALLIFGSNPKSFTSVVSWSGLTLAGGQLKIQGVTIVTILVSMAVLLVLQWFVHGTREGQAMLAVSQDRGAATLMGINVNHTISLTFAIGSALAAVAGALLCSAWRHWLDPRRHDRRHRARRHRDPGEDLHLLPALRCHRVRDPRHRAPCEADRNPWQEHSGKGLRRLLT